MQFRLYSDYPFRSRKDGGPRDDFERDALARAEARPRRAGLPLRDLPGPPVAAVRDRPADAGRLHRLPQQRPEQHQAGLEGGGRRAASWRSSARSTATSPGPARVCGDVRAHGGGLRGAARCSPAWSWWSAAGGSRNPLRAAGLKPCNAPALGGVDVRDPPNRSPGDRAGSFFQRRIASGRQTMSRVSSSRVPRGRGPGHAGRQRRARPWPRTWAWRRPPWRTRAPARLTFGAWSRSWP